MSEQGNDNVLEFFDAVAPHFLEMLGKELSPGSLELVVDEARRAFIELLPDVPYLDNPSHTMAESTFFSAVGLAFLKPVRTRGFDLHSVGRAIYEFCRLVNEPATGKKDSSRSDRARNKSKREAAESQQSNDRSIFVWEIVENGDQQAPGYNITSCAICHLYGKHDAIELVPYMCAGDDLVSNAYDQGLRRTGTIGLGAHTCDFRFHYGQTGEPLVQQFPDQIRVSAKT